MRVVVVIVPSFFLVDWAIEITRTSPSIPVAFLAQPRAFKIGMAEQADTTMFVRWPFTVGIIGAVVTLVYACVVLVSTQRKWLHLN
jgi:hypothetical protein